MSRRCDREGVWMPRRRDVLATRCAMAETFGHVYEPGQLARISHARVMEHLRERPVLP